MHNREKHYHKILAEYFMAQAYFFDGGRKMPNIRKCIEQPFQTISTKMWNEAEATLTDILFVDAKIKASLIYRLIEDYIFFIEQGSKENINTEWTLEWLNFLRAKSGFFQRYINSLPDVVLQEALNTSTLSRLHESTNKLEKNMGTRIELMGLKEKGEEYPLTIHVSAIITHVAFSADSGAVLTASSDGSLKLWSIITGNIISSFVGHESRIEQCCFSNNEDYILSVSHDCTARIWSIETRMTAHLLKGHNNPILSGGFSPDGKFVVTGGEDQFIIVWSRGEISLKIPVELQDQDQIIKCGFVSDDRFYYATKKGRLYIHSLKVEFLLLRGNTSPVGDDLRKGIVLSFPVKDTSLFHKNSLVCTSNNSIFFVLEEKLILGKNKEFKSTLYCLNFGNDQQRQIELEETILFLAPSGNECLVTTPSRLIRISNKDFKVVTEKVWNNRQKSPAYYEPQVITNGTLVAEDEGSNIIRIWKIEAYIQNSNFRHIKPSPVRADKRTNLFSLGGTESKVVSVIFLDEDRVIAVHGDCEHCSMWQLETSNKLNSFSLNDNWKITHIAKYNEYIYIKGEYPILSDDVCFGTKIDLQAGVQIDGVLGTEQEFSDASRIMDLNKTSWVNLPWISVIGSKYGKSHEKFEMKISDGCLEIMDKKSDNVVAAWESTRSSIVSTSGLNMSNLMAVGCKDGQVYCLKFSMEAVN